MEKKAVSGIMLTLLLTSMLTLAFFQPAKSEPRTWIVGNDGLADFHTIRDVIKAVCFEKVEQRGLPEEIIEGNHVKFFLKEKVTGSIPKVALNSSWARVTPNIDGFLTSEEWEDAFLTDIFGANLAGKIYVKNDDNFVYFAFDISADATNNRDVMTLNFNILADNPHYLTLYSSGESFTDLAGVIWKSGFKSHRMWEIQIPVFELGELGDVIRIGITSVDGCETTNIFLSWPAFENGKPLLWGNLALASSPSSEGKGMTYRGFIEDLIPALDQAYKILMEFFDYTPFGGEKISIVVDSSISVHGYSGNPIVVYSPFSLSLLFHEMGHDFTALMPSGITAASEAVANLCSYYLIVVRNITFSNVLLEDLRPSLVEFKIKSLAALNKYEQNGSPFSELNLLDGSGDGFWVISGILYYLIDSHGWNVFSKLNVRLTYSLPKNISDLVKNLNELAYRLSFGAMKDLTPIFRERWNFPIIGMFKVPKPAEFKIIGLLISPATVKAEEKVMIIVNITNIGEVEGTYALSLKINGVVEATREVTLAGETSITETFHIVKDVAGDYIVEVDGLTNTFTVTAPKPVEKEIPPPPPWELYATIVAAVLVALGAIIIIYSKR